jgi:hypothetical protein
MPLSAAQRAENRKDIMAGKRPRNWLAITALDAQTIDATWSASEQAAMQNNIARLNDIADLLRSLEMVL